MKIHRYAIGLLICLAFQTQGAFGDTQAFVKTASLHVRVQPVAEAESVGGLKKNDRVLVEKDLGEWLQISFEGGKGYIASRMTDLSQIEAIGQTSPLKAIKVGDPQISLAAGESLDYYEKTNEYALINKNGRLYYVHTSLLNFPEAEKSDPQKPEVKDIDMRKLEDKSPDSPQDTKEKAAKEKVASGTPAETETVAAEEAGAVEEQALFALAELEIVASPIFEEAESTLFAAPLPEPELMDQPSSMEEKAVEKNDLPPAHLKVVEKTDPPSAKGEAAPQVNKIHKEATKKESKPEPKMESAGRPAESALAPVTRSYRIPRDGITADLSDPLMQRAFSILGSPYVYGSRGPEAFDCSGFTYYVFGQEGRKIPRTSEDQSKSGSAVDYEDLQPGDLLFFDTRSSVRLNDITDSADPDSAPVLQPSKVTHVGIYIGEGKMIHASSSQRKVIIAEVGVGYFAQRLVTARRY